MIASAQQTSQGVAGNMYCTLTWWGCNTLQSSGANSVSTNLPSEHAATRLLTCWHEGQQPLLAVLAVHILGPVGVMHIPLTP